MVDSRERATRSRRFDSKETQNALKSQKDAGESFTTKTRRREGTTLRGECRFDLFRATAAAAPR